MSGSNYQETLEAVFGFDSFRPGQERIIKQVLAGNSALAVFPTGSGKSLCYQLPALMLDGLTIVISPLIALMKDQVDFLLGKGVKVARLDSTLSAAEARQVYSDVRAGSLKLLYVAPERISNERFFAAIEGHVISLMVIDEAHCISEWGHNFRPEYLKLAIAARALKVERVLALTATATPSVVEDIVREFEIQREAYVNTGFHRPNLHLEFSPTPEAERMGALQDRLNAIPVGPTVVYVTLQKTAEEVAAQLVADGFSARAYHAGMKSEQRAEIQDWFMASTEGIVVATIAFGMGIDKSDIRRVFHFNLPKTLENYSQEIGRAGRDGKPSHCEVLGSGEDLVVLENFIFGDTPTEESIRVFASFMLEQEDEFDISLYQLSQLTDIRPLVLSTLLTYLELEGVIEFTAPFYSEYKFKYLEPKSEVLAAFKGEPGEFLKRLLAQANEKKTWSYLNLDTAAKALGADRNRIVKAFNHLEEKGMLEVGVTGLRQGMRMLDRQPEIEVVRNLVEKVERNEAGNLERTRNVVELLNVEGCKTRFLLSYFGEELSEDCGHCGYCETETVVPVGRAAACLSDEERVVVERFEASKPGGVSTAREGARFLCGIASPKTSRSRANRSEFFGRLEKTPFEAVLNSLADTE
ncbi:RecQ family ATP-dependent DNA helicase [Pelagicoccus mobilis]|uniref:ATP-dependent DNA helicase RecQ n=1 Tax=Pelagicoccus mobilis TaxID=415221 RepID=A0A934RWY6_9BACT|nr:ATP-dependent DNA helicase RecQ [Pelagicoccus mobilis]MBK1879265.1 RecQ family ATP-dependent DNA helicase [Pelagicoccus mobilis]